MSTMIEKYRAHLIKDRLFSDSKFIGYHLVVGNAYYWIGRDVDEAESNLETAVNRYADKGVARWYIDRLDGFSGDGRALYSNLDHTDSII